MPSSTKGERPKDGPRFIPTRLVYVMGPIMHRKKSERELMCHIALGSWADEMEDMPMPSAPSGRGGYGGDRSYNSGGGFSSGGFAGLPA